MTIETSTAMATLYRVGDYSTTDYASAMSKAQEMDRPVQADLAEVTEYRVGDYVTTDYDEAVEWAADSEIFDQVRGWGYTKSEIVELVKV